MKVAVLSLFRDSAGAQVRRWSSQVAALQAAMPDDHVVAVAVEGDSVDGTERDLHRSAAQYGLDLQIVKCDVGVMRFPSCENPVRLRALSKCLNAGMNSIKPDVDVVVYVESDLLWDAETFLGLIDLASNGTDVVAPLVYAGEVFYDIWGFRGLDGHRFIPFVPYHDCLVSPDLLAEVSSVGSCIAMKGEVARRSRVYDEDALVGWCSSARINGYRIYVAPMFKVRHP